MGILYDSKKEACAKCRSGEETQIDKKTKKYHNVRSPPKKKAQSSKKLTYKDLVNLKGE
ncbi:MAG: hypothetical protein WC406_09445 [Methanoregula sp.]